MTQYHYYTELSDDTGRVRQKINGNLEAAHPISTSSMYLEVSNKLESQAREGFGAGAEILRFTPINLSRLN